MLNKHDCYGISGPGTQWESWKPAWEDGSEPGGVLGCCPGSVWLSASRASTFLSEELPSEAKASAFVGPVKGSAVWCGK